jgi:NAD(P)-dependent dehydrogenase (short-subunit alcohol dehydrogenase family)
MYRVKPNDGVVWITGASSGIGRAVAIELAQKGYTVAVTARRQEKLIDFGYDNIHAYAGDVTSRKSMKQVVSNIEQDLGPINLAFLNAGGFFANKAPFDDAFRKTIDLNFGGVINGLEQIYPCMHERKKGHIVLMSSVTGFGGIPDFSTDYVVSKSAIIVLAESLMYQFKSKNIRLQIVTPSFIETGLISKKIYNTPFNVSLERAAKLITNGIERGGFEITFPKITAWTLKFIHAMPYPIYFKLIKFTMSKINRRVK